MNEAYEELIGGQRVLRRPPTSLHETLVARLHQLVARSFPLNSTLRLLGPRSELELDGHSILRPDLAMVLPAAREFFLEVSNTVRREDNLSQMTPRQTGSSLSGLTFL